MGGNPVTKEELAVMFLNFAAYFIKGNGAKLPPVALNSIFMNLKEAIDKVRDEGHFGKMGEFDPRHYK